MQYLLVLVRHAETEGNVRGEIQGHKDSQLSLNGIHGAEILAEWLSPVNFSHVVTSDLGRAIRTSEIVLSRNKAASLNSSKLTFIRDERIRERNFGEKWSGRPFRELYAEASRAGAVYPNFAPDGVETLHQLRQRASEFFAFLSRTMHSTCKEPFLLNPEARSRLGISQSVDLSKISAIVLLVTHGGIIRELLADLAAKKLVHGGLPAAAQKLAGNCCYSTIVVNVGEQSSPEIALSCVKDIQILSANAKPQELHPNIKLPFTNSQH